MAAVTAMQELHNAMLSDLSIINELQQQIATLQTQINTYQTQHPPNPAQPHPIYRPPAPVPFY